MPLSKLVKVTLSTDHQQLVSVKDNYALPILDDLQWLQIPGEDGGETAIPVARIIAIAVEGKPKRGRA